MPIPHSFFLLFLVGYHSAKDFYQEKGLDPEKLELEPSHGKSG